MALYRDEAVVLKTMKLGEADRIVVLFTRRHGKIRAVAKGVRRTKSRFGARLEPFMRVDLLLNEGRTFEGIRQAESISPYAGTIISDYDAFRAANVIAEIANDLVSAEKEPAEPQYQLLIGALNALARHYHHPTVVAQSYIMRAFALAGWTPRLDTCVVCDRHDDLSYFNASAGGLMCTIDHTPGSRRVTPLIVERLQALLDGDWTILDWPIETSDTAAGTTERIVEDWSQAILERPIRSMRLLD